VAQGVIIPVGEAPINSWRNITGASKVLRAEIERRGLVQAQEGGSWDILPENIKLIFSRIWPFGFTFQIMWLMLIVRQNAIDHGGVDIHLMFYGGFGIAALIVALFFIYVYRKKAVRHIANIGLCLFGMVCMIVATCTLSLEPFSGSQSAAAIGTTVGGVGTISGMLGWGSYFKELPLEHSVTYILGAYIIDFFLMPLLRMLFPAASFLILIAFALGGPICLMLSERRAKKDKLLEIGAGGRSCLGQGDGAGVPSSLQDGQAFSTMGRLLAAFAIYSFVLTLRSPVAQHSNDAFLFILSYAALVATFVLFWSLIIRRSYISLERVLQVFLMIFAIGFFLLPFSSGYVNELLAQLFFTMTALIFMWVWVAVVNVARTSTIHPFAVVGIWGACYGCPRLLYFLVDAIMDRLGLSMDTTMIASFVALFGLFVAFFLLSRQPADTRPFFHEFGQTYRFGGDDEAKVKANWDKIAQDYKLTDRESDIFILLCEGHSKRYIAEHLFISENTVKAHQKKIYAKIGVHSKLELEEVIWPG
jgi:DNA-binding CsgD family transcriptional regulator